MMTTETVAITQNDDAELVAACLEGHLDSFGRIVERYQSLICSLAYSATGSLSRSEDLAQETFVTAWKELSGLREPHKLRPWLCGIARNLIGKTLRRDEREPTHAADTLEAAEHSPSTDKLPTERVISREEEAILWRAIERVPQLYREPLVLFYREHQSVATVASALDLTEETVRQRLSRGRKLLHGQVIAFVEGALEDSNPGKAFTIGVLGALPLLAATTAGATAATTAGSVAAKSSATAKTVGGMGALSAVLTAGVICYFSVLGFLIFLGICIGYIMSRALRQSSRQFEYGTRFWRALAFGFGGFVAGPLALVFGFGLSAGTHPGLYHGLTLWMGLIYVAVPVALLIWLGRWWRESVCPSGATQAGPQGSLKRFYAWFGLGMAVPVVFFSMFLYGILFQQSFSGERLSRGDLQRIVVERKDADFKVVQYQNGSQSLSIRLPESRRRVIYHASVDSATLALLAQNHISYQTFVEGKDTNQLGTPWRLLGLLAFFLTPVGVVVLLQRPRQVEFETAGQSDTSHRDDRRARNAFRAFAVSMAVGLAALATFIGLITRWDTRTITLAELPAVVAEHESARYVVAQYNDGSSELLVTPREAEGSKIVAPADADTLAWLEGQGIPYRHISQGRDFGHADPKPWFSMVCIIALLSGAVLLLAWATRGMRLWSLAFGAGFAVTFLLVCGAGLAQSSCPGKLFVSTARVKVTEQPYASSKQEDREVVTSRELLDRVVSRLGLEQKWGEGNVKLSREGAVGRLKQRVRVEPLPRPDGEVLEIVCYAQDSKEAAAIANAVAEEFTNHRNQGQAVAQLIAPAMPGNQMISNFKPARLIVGSLVGCVAGLLVGTGCVWYQARRRAGADAVSE